MALAPLSQSNELTHETLLPVQLEPSRRLHQVQGDLNKLQSMVQSIQAVLQDAEEREVQDQDQLVKLWLRELKAVAYDAEDVLDEYDYELRRAEVEASCIQTDEASVGHLPCKRKYGQEVSENSAITSIPFDASFCGKVADEIQKIRQRFDEISKNLVNLHSEERNRHEWGASRKRADRRQSSHLLDTEKIHGRKDDVGKVIDLLLCSHDCRKRNLSVLPIVGMGGVGKTTLVQHVYNDQRVSDHFQMKGWVCVSDDFTVVELTRRIIESLTNMKCDLQELSVLHERLRVELEGKRFLLVLDDVWNEDRRLWESLQKPLRFGAQGSAVMATTRSEIVAKIMQTVPFHQLKCLSTNFCWEVFRQSAFGDRDPSDHPDLMEAGLKIVAKCGGLPLAAKSLGGLLSYETEAAVWEDVLQSDVWDSGGQSDEIIPALRLSYVHLPSHLKQCFLYASIFPKGFKFKKCDIVLLWMAQGFLPCRDSKQMSEVDLGNKWFDHLLQRSFFQHYSGRPREVEEPEFVMHDLIHDLARHISGEEFFHMDSDRSPLSYPYQVHHVSLINQEAKDLEKVVHAPWSNIRTLIFRQTQYAPMLRPRRGVELPVLQVMPLLNFLRTLDLGHSVISELPDSVGHLKHLRYLNLDHTDIARLPDSICKLYNLRILSLVSCEKLQCLPKDVKNLCNLKHLKIASTRFDHIPSGFGRLTSLQTLDEFLVCPKATVDSSVEHSKELNLGRLDGESCGVEVLKEMNELSGKLMISGLQHVKDAEDARRADLRSKRNTKKLVLSWYEPFVDGVVTSSQGMQTQVLENLQPPDRLEVLEIEYFGGLGFPSWMGGDPSSLSRLVRVRMEHCKQCASLPALGQLPCLKRLQIKMMDMVEAVGSEFYGRARVAFPKLEELEFDSMKNWVTWEMTAAEKLVFPGLRRLCIWGCHRLKSMVPLHLLRALEELQISNCRMLISIDLWNHGLPSSGDINVRLPPLKKLKIVGCPQARFPPEDGEHLFFPPTLGYLTIKDSPLLVQWCERGQGCRVARVPNAKFWMSLKDGSKILSTARTRIWDGQLVFLYSPSTGVRPRDGEQHERQRS